MKELENNWMKKWESVKEKTVCPVDLNTYFEQEEIAGKSLTTINIGSCDLPSGNLLVRDPLVYLPNRNERPYFQNAPAGKYETEINRKLHNRKQRKIIPYSLFIYKK